MPFIHTEKLILKFIWKGKKTRIAKTFLEKNKVGIVTLFNIKLHLTTLITTV